MARGVLPRHTVKGAPSGREQYPVPPSMRKDITQEDTDGPEKIAAWRKQKPLRLSLCINAVRDNVEPLKKHDLLPVREVGRGSNGIAFALRNGKVLKVTVDKSEALASYKLEGRKNKYVVNIERVFKFKNTGQNHVFGIVQEMLQPLSSAEEDELDRAIETVTVAINNGETDENKQDSDKFTWSFDELADAARTGAGTPYSEGDIERALNTLRNFNIDEMMDELMRRGIRFHDYHSGNVMKRGDRYVITDLGVSEVVGVGAMPPVLEAGGLSTAPTRPTGSKRDIFAMIIRENDHLLKKNQLEIELDSSGDPKELGEGQNGIAYPLRDGRVLKITVDKREAVSSFHIEGKDIPHVVRIYRVFRFPKRTVFGIVQERLRPMPPADAEAIAAATSWMLYIFNANKDGRVPIGRKKRAPVYHLGWDKFIEATQALIDDLPDEFYDDTVSAVQVLQRFHVDKMMNALRDAGIQFIDYHEGNLMLSMDGKPTITDIGVSNVVGGGKDPPQLESVVSEITDRIVEELSDRVLVIYGQFQPFSKVQADTVRRLARKGKVVLLLQRGPIGFAAMREIVKASLPEIEARLELYDAAEMDLSQAIDHAEEVGSAGLRPGVGLEVYSGDPASARESLQSSAVFSRSAAVFRKLGDEAGVDSGAFQGIRAGRLKDVLDPHVFSDRARAREVESLLKTHLHIESVVESLVRSLVEMDLADVGGLEIATKFVQHNAGALRKYVDVDRLEHLGMGEKSVAWDGGRNRVLKVTANLDDVSIAMRLKGKRLDHVAQVYDVFELERPEGVKHDMFAIIAEKVTPLSEEEEDEVNRQWINVRQSDEYETMAEQLAAGRLDEFFDTFRQARLREKLADVQGDPALSKRVARQHAEAVRQVEEEARALWDMMRKYEIHEMVTELTGVGVRFADYKGDNMGKRGNTYVLLDTGGIDNVDPAQSFQRPPKITSHGATQEAMGVRDNSRMVNPSMRSQSSPWSTGKVTEPLPKGQGIDDVDQEGDESSLARRRLGIMVKEVMRGLARK